MDSRDLRASSKPTGCGPWDSHRHALIAPPRYFGFGSPHFQTHAPNLACRMMYR